MSNETTVLSTFDTSNVLENIKQGHSNLSEIRSNLFEVKPIRLHPNIEGFNSPETFGIYKNTGGDALGVVGNKYYPTQPIDIFTPFADCLENQGVDLTKLKYSELKGGAKIKFTAPIDTIGFTNMAGKQDETIVSINLMTGYDGLTKTSLFLSCYRMVCKNGMKANVTEFQVSFKNTISNFGKVQSMCEDVAKSISMVKNLEELILRMNSVKITQQQQDEFIKKVTGLSRTEYKDYSSRKQNIFDSINRSVGLEIDRTGASVFGLLNGITHYTNHVASKNNVEEYIYVDTGEDLNQKAQKFALELLN